MGNYTPKQPKNGQKNYKSTILLLEMKHTSNINILDYYVCYKNSKTFHKNHTKAEHKAN
jgi:hypothetical protein